MAAVPGGGLKGIAEGASFAREAPQGVRLGRAGRFVLKDKE